MMMMRINERVPFIAAPGLVLLPKGILPLQVTEKNQIDAVHYALGKGREIGVVQLSEPKSMGLKHLSTHGCLAKIMAFSENTDGSLVLVLKGMRRFKVLVKEHKHLPRLLNIEWDAWKSEEDQEITSKERIKLFHLLEDHITENDVKIDWHEFLAATDEALINLLAFVYPFAPQEKQALLESKSPQDSLRLLTAFLEFSALEKQQPCLSIN